jgi:hypothetical protein
MSSSRHTGAAICRSLSRATAMQPAHHGEIMFRQ